MRLPREQEIVIAWLYGFVTGSIMMLVLFGLGMIIHHQAQRETPQSSRPEMHPRAEGAGGVPSRVGFLLP
jgi:hypothetical protein